MVLEASWSRRDFELRIVGWKFLNVVLVTLTQSVFGLILQPVLFKLVLILFSA